MTREDTWLEIPPHIQTLQPYQPGKPIEELERELGITGVIKLASNENPLGPSPRAVEAVLRAIHSAHLYPDSGEFVLRRAIAERLSVSPEEIMMGAGSNEIIYLLVRALCRPGVDQVVTHRHAFISYAVAARTHGVEVVETAVKENLGCDVDALCDAFGPRTRIVFLASPNNPTGAQISRRELEQVLERAPARALVVIDEAYYEYAIELDDDYPSAQPYRHDRPWIMSLRTFSKIHGLAGLRVGYGVADPRVVSLLDRTRVSFNVSNVAQAAALAALDDTEHVTQSVAQAREGLATLGRELAAKGLRVLPSRGNFVLVDLARDAAPVYQAMLARGVIVRPMAAWGLPHHLRISLGTASEIARTIDAVSGALS